MVRLVIEIDDEAAKQLAADADDAGRSLEDHIKALLGVGGLTPAMVESFKRDFERYRAVYDRLAQ